MSIVVKCPHGHVLKVKDKYAGKKGRCPFCNEVVSVPLREEDIVDLIGEPSSRDSVFDDAGEDPESVLDDADSGSGGETLKTSSTMSLVGTSAVRHRQNCPECSEDVPYWYATCPRCGTHLPGTT